MILQRCSNRSSCRRIGETRLSIENLAILNGLPKVHVSAQYARIFFADIPHNIYNSKIAARGAAPWISERSSLRIAESVMV